MTVETLPRVCVSSDAVHLPGIGYRFLVYLRSSSPEDVSLEEIDLGIDPNGYETRHQAERARCRAQQELAQEMDRERVRAAARGLRDGLFGAVGAEG